jgi:hypothetical protein
MKTLILTERLDLSEAQFDTDARVLQVDLESRLRAH